MAISAVHYREMVAVRELLPQNGAVLQIGEANWYGDLDPRVILELTDSQAVVDQIECAIAARDLFAIAKVFYSALFAPQRIDSVDANGTETALRWDLNRPLKLERKYDLIVNHGTAEHVFHVAQVFGTMHAWTCDGGLMIHEAPFLGWPDHGFYTLQPTLFYDLAAANGYELLRMSVCDHDTRMIIPIEDRRDIHRRVQTGALPRQAVLFVVMRKRGNEEFRIPMQGYYDGKLDAEGVQAWEHRA